MENQCDAGIDFLEFRCSEIAAATAIFVSKELETNEIDDVLTRFAVVEKVTWWKPLSPDIDINTFVINTSKL